jgi:hypothetical protein
MDTWTCAQIPVLYDDDADAPRPRCPECDLDLKCALA